MSGEILYVGALRENGRYRFVSHSGDVEVRVQGTIKEITAPKDVPIRLEPKDGSQVLGVIEQGAEVVVTDRVVDFYSVLPKDLAVAPGPQGQFWASAKDLGDSK